MDHPLASHLSLEAQRRQPSLAKSLYAYHLIDDMQSLGGGLPDSRYFPINHALFDLPDPYDASKCTSVDLWSSIRAANGETSTVDLAVAQQYQAGSGLVDLTNILERFADALHRLPPAGNHNVALSLGNTDAVAKLFRLLLNPGDNILFEEFVFGPPVENARSMGCGLVPVPMDAQGADAEALDRMLDNWKPAAHGPKPRVFYTVTTGQNPTGTTPSLKRLRALYAVARKHDLVLIEDDPYYMLQLGDYHRDSAMMEEMHVAGAPVRPNVKSSLDDFAATLAPTLISLDVDGRVARCESMSKVFFPGARLGWVILNPLFRERYERLSELIFNIRINQAFFAQVLTEPSKTSPNAGGWGMEGFISWVNKLRRAYASRRDFALDILKREMGEDADLISCVAPEAGMFIWMKVHLEKHPRFRSNEGSRPRTNMADLMQELFDNCVANKCLVLPARFFFVDHTLPAGFKSAQPIHLTDDIRDRSNFFRATFAPPEATIEEALKRFTSTLREFFKA